MKIRKPILLLCVLLLSGCVTGDGTGGVGMIEPPPLELQTGPVAPRVTHVNIKNGAGEVLFDGKPDAKGLISTNPDRSKLDGTLVITSSWNDRVTNEVQTLKHEPGKPVKISPHSGVPRAFQVEVVETEKVEEKKAGWGDYLGPIIGGGISIGGGGRGGDRGGSAGSGPWAPKRFLP